MTPAALSVLVLAGSILGCLIGLQLAIGVLCAFVPATPVAVAKTIATALAAAMRGGGDLPPAIAAAAPRLRWPFSWRARAAAERLAEDPLAGLVWTLSRQRLVPPALLASGEAAERLGGAALLRWADGLAVRPGWTETLLRPMAPYLGVVLLMAGVISFIQIFITPKFEQIARDLGASVDPRLLLLPQSEALPWLILPALILAGALFGRWHWRRMCAQAAAETILAGTASGASEGEIGEAFDGSGIRAAGHAGDFAGLVQHATGWRGIADPARLSAALDAHIARQRRHDSCLHLALQFAVPLVVAVPVWLLATGIFATLIQFMTVTSIIEGLP